MEIILRVASSVLRNENFKILFHEMPVAFYEWRAQDEKYTS